MATPEDQPNIPLWRKPEALFTAFFHKDTRDTLFEAGKLTVTLMFIIANALILKHVLTDEQIPQQIASAMLSAGQPKALRSLSVEVSARQLEHV